MVQNKLCRDANDAVGLSKQRKVGLDWEEFLCSFVLTVPLHYLHFSCFVFSLFPLSEDKEKDILLRINSCPKAVYHDPVARRFRRKLILRQVHTCCPVHRRKGGVQYKQSLFCLVHRDAKKKKAREWTREIWG